MGYGLQNSPPRFNWLFGTFGILNLSFVLAQDGELVEPFWDLAFGI